MQKRNWHLDKCLGKMLVTEFWLLRHLGVKIISKWQQSLCIDYLNNQLSTSFILIVKLQVHFTLLSNVRSFM